MSSIFPSLPPSPPAAQEHSHKACFLPAPRRITSTSYALYVTDLPNMSPGNKSVPCLLTQNAPLSFLMPSDIKP